LLLSKSANYKSRRAAPNNKSLRPKEKKKNSTKPERVCECKVLRAKESERAN